MPTIKFQPQAASPPTHLQHPEPIRKIPLALYAHIPFCKVKCHYCAFDSVAVHSDTFIQRWLHAFLHDLQFQAQNIGQNRHRISSIFLGGGTPSIIPAKIIEQILEHLTTIWSMDDHPEITLEANPDSTTPAKLDAWHSMGINRLSLGVQAMDDHRLALLGRPHTAHQARQTFEAARNAGFDNINLDLIHGSPGHTLDSWRHELTRAMMLQPEHLSCYSLMVESGTPLERLLNSGTMQLPDEETAANLFFLTRDLLEDQGWERYEISNHARNRRYCQHNLGIWRSGDYLGIGPSAHGKITLEDGSVLRSINHWPLETYLDLLEHNHPPHCWVEHASPKEAAAECLLMGLRLTDGIPRALYHDIAGVDLVDHKKKEVYFLVGEGLLVIDSCSIRLTSRGLDFLDECLTRLI
ncbi:MAG: radical SAM family heme chaperone HemW [Magnetococcales bacterium]|nr:radical SAM family heme chaperone HemW [Magnetococcales bacterium]